MSKIQKTFIASIMRQLRIEQDPFVETFIREALEPVNKEEYQEFFERIFQRSDFIALDRIKHISSYFQDRRNHQSRLVYEHGEKVFRIISSFPHTLKENLKEVSQDPHNLKKIKIDKFTFTDEDILKVIRFGGIGKILSSTEKEYKEFMDMYKAREDVKVSIAKDEVIK